MKLNLHLKGSSTSGNHGHAGRPGHRGGSAPQGEGGGSAAPKTETSSAPLEPHDIAQAIQIAYEISDASGGETTDAGEAARIFSERTGKKLTDAQVQQIEEAVNNEFKVENYDSQLTAPKPAPTVVTRPIRARELADKLGMESGGSTELRSGVPSSVKNLLPYGVNIPNDDKNVFTFGHGFFYRHGNSGESFAAKIEKNLNDAGYNAETLYSGEHYYPGFVGGAKLFSARDSFFYSVVRVTRK